MIGHYRDARRSARCLQLLHRRREEPIVPTGAFPEGKHDMVQSREPLRRRARFFELLEFPEQTS